MSSTFRMKWKSDFDKQVILQNFEKRGWVRCSGEGRPHPLTQQTIGTSTGPTSTQSTAFLMPRPAIASARLSKPPPPAYPSSRLLNHYPNHYELTRKDLMVKNIKK